MKKKLITVTIGIPAYNEGVNVENLMNKALELKGSFFKVEMIIFVSDASTDSTDEKIKSMLKKEKRLVFIKNDKRRGQIYAHNLIFKKAKTDVVVILEADTYPKDKNYLTELLKPIYENPRIGLVQGNIEEETPHTFFQEVMSYQKKVYHNHTVSDQNVSKWFTSGRGGRAFNSFVYNKLRWPKAVPEDVYALLWCVKRNIKTTFSKNAKCIYRLPQNFNEFVLQRKKARYGTHSLKNYYSQDLIAAVYGRNKTDNLKMAIEFLIKYPTHYFYYLYTKVRLITLSNKGKFTDFMPTVTPVK